MKILNTAELVSFEEADRLLEYDPETGNMVWRVRMGARTLAGDPAGTVHHKRSLQVCIAGRIYQSHRIAWLLAYREWPQGCVDHIDGNSLNNRLDNLRDVSHRTNCENKHRPSRSNTSGYLGVSRFRDKWQAQIKVKGKVIPLGRFEDPVVAHEAYLAAKRSLHIGCTI